jgi:hypothetical protein
MRLGWTQSAWRVAVFGRRSWSNRSLMEVVGTTAVEPFGSIGA